MKKKVRFRIQSRPGWTNDMRVQHVLPSTVVQTIGPFILLDHLCSYKENQSHKKVPGTCPHPHRGVAALTYIISGEVEHLDSMGNHVKLSSGSAHWMNAGKGVLRDEAVKPDFRINNPDVSVIRFWINLPSKHKCEEPGYFSLLQSDIPKEMLANKAGWIKILCGNYKNIVAKVPCYSKQFLYHIHLEAEKQFSVITDSELEYAVFLLTGNVVINDNEFQAGEFIVFDSLGELIEINNSSSPGVDIILFGGESYNEPIAIDEAFVMNNPHEITQAYNDYYDGKYGDISFNKIKDK